MTDTTLLGAEGVLVVGTRGPAGVGEVQLHLHGATELYLAWSAEPLGRGKRVLVTNVRGGRTVDVEPVAEFLPDPPADSADATDPSSRLLDLE